MTVGGTVEDMRTEKWTVGIAAEDYRRGQRYQRWLPHGYRGRILTNPSDGSVLEADIGVLDTGISASRLSLDVDHLIRIARDDAVGWLQDPDIVLEPPVGAGRFRGALARLARRDWYADRLSEYARQATSRKAGKKKPGEGDQHPEALRQVLESTAREFDSGDYAAVFEQITDGPGEFRWIGQIR